MINRIPQKIQSIQTKMVQKGSQKINLQQRQIEAGLNCKTGWNKNIIKIKAQMYLKKSIKKIGKYIAFWRYKEQCLKVN